jgi:hypothetical protein
MKRELKQVEYSLLVIFKLTYHNKEGRELHKAKVEKRKINQFQI